MGIKLHAHRLFYLPRLGFIDPFMCLCCGQRFSTHEKSFIQPCTSVTVHLEAIPVGNNVYSLKHPESLTLEMCGTRPADLPKNHSHLPGQIALDRGLPANTCLACASELSHPAMRENWTPLR